MTTIKVDTAVRDRLAALAREHGRTLGQEVAALVDQAERLAEQPEPRPSLWAEFEEDYERLQADSQAWDSYLGQFEPNSRRPEARIDVAEDPAVYPVRRAAYLGGPLPRRETSVVSSPAA